MNTLVGESKDNMIFFFPPNIVLKVCCMFMHYFYILNEKNGDIK